EIIQFHKAIRQFKTDLPNLLIWCRDEIDGAKSNAAFNEKAGAFLEQCRNEINPDFAYEDIREILVQHMLTDRLFTAVIQDADFIKENNIARSINESVRTFFSLEKRKQFEERNKHFYNAIVITASQISDYRDKQEFLKTLYEEFYKSYNPKAADRMGVIYTPSPIVNFMVRVTDELLAKHFNTGLAEKNVTIIDPAAGTGTFITELIEYIPPQKLKEKYLNDMFANEVSILPYYVSNLNIEYIYWQKMNEYLPFPNICYTDTLDNAYYKLDPFGQSELLDFVSEENIKRLKAQNESKISVIIGNPPYNANQKNYNNQNANRAYPKIDKRVRETFTVESRAQKKKYEDIYFRFYRWAMDRIDNENGGIIAFVTNRSFIDAVNTDGFRSVISDEFDYLYILDTRSDVRKNPRLSGTKHNVFGIQTGVALMFAVKAPNDKQAKPVISYYSLQDEQTKEEKLDFLKHNKLSMIPWDRLYPDKNNNWLHISHSDFETLMPLAVKNNDENAVFYDCSAAVSTNRTDWLFDFSEKELKKKVKHFVKIYNGSIDKNKIDASIKWSRDLVNIFNRKIKVKHSDSKIIFSMFRPYVKKYYYADSILSDRLTSNHLDCLSIKNNIYITFSGKGFNHGFSVFASSYIPELHSIENGQCVPMYILNKSKKKTANVTGWALKTFTGHYQDEAITKKDIFHYVYAVLHDPCYALKYADDLRRNAPRIPFYEDFHQWAAWGKSLMSLHSNYENAKEHPLKTQAAKSGDERGQLKYDKSAGRIIIDDVILSGVPPAILNYKLSQRSPLEWIIDQYKIKKIEDPVVAEKFNSYSLSPYKNEIISLIKKIITVSLETIKITDLMQNEGKTRR
ncbi:MAG: N-6 DNA methylase, partial [Treponema sp.]|nr:N-6 DNA methylase [Treponema sp.]